MNVAAMSDDEPISSPCISVCTLDPTRAYCIGCLRTVKEIGAWRTMTVAEKRAVIAACEERARTRPVRGKDGKPLPK
jgi:predicted Fe-S protein YdhL (DUF1289 family)